MKRSLTQEVRRVVGSSCIVLSIFATWIIWLSTLKSYVFIVKDPFLFLSKVTVLAGTIGMCWTFILATRARVLEILFGGLDKVYHVHKNVGKMSFFAICLHPFFQYLRFVPQWNKAHALFIPHAIDGIFFGLFAFALFVFLIACTLWIPLPYHIWKYTHSFFIVVLICSFFHIYLMDKQVNASPLLRIWMYGFMGLAFISYVYIKFLYYYFGPRLEYEVTGIQKLRKTWNVFLRPLGKPLSYNPGQFVYISFDNPHLGSEVHPFSLSSHPGQKDLRLTIKNLGDYTAGMDNLKVDDDAIIWGPYGHFYEKYLYNPSVSAVFIAGGIGITPFLSMLAHEAQHSSDRKSYIFYCVKQQERADFHQELLNLSDLNKNIVYSLHCSDAQGYLNIQEIEKVVGSLDKKNFFLCGPKPMMDSFINQLRAAGVKNNAIISEDFNFL